MANLGSMMDRFTRYCHYERNLSHKTVQSYSIDLAQFASHLEGSRFTTSVRETDREDIRSYIDLLRERYRPRTIRRKIATLKAFFNYLESEDIIVINPIRRMRICVRTPRSVPRTIPLGDVKQVFRHVYRLKAKSKESSPYAYLEIVRDIAILEMLFATGARVSEVSGLTVDDIDLQSRLIRFLGKGQKQRVVPICSEEVKSALSEYAALRPKVENEATCFFLNRSGRAISEQSIRFMIHKHSHAAGVKLHITPHMFRHTVATTLLTNGMDIRCIQDILGHSSISTTEIYAHIEDEFRRKEIRRKHPRRKMSVE